MTFQPGDPSENCAECGYLKPLGAACPNPACWPGLRAFLDATDVWQRGRDADVAVRMQRLPGLSGLNARKTFEHFYEEANPRPARNDFER